MIIPNKFNGFHNGVRRCFGGAGGGGGGGDGPNEVYAPPANTTTTNTGNTTFNSNRGNVTGMNFTGGNTAGTSTIPSNNLNLQNMYGKPYNQSGQQYNALLQQGFTGNDIRNSLTTQGRPVSDSDYGYLVQNAGMTSPTGRPYAGSDQFFQPVYNSQYQNYARPATQFNVSSYGTQPSNSPLLNQTSRGNVNNALNTFYNSNYRDNPNGVGMGDTLDFMRQNGINRDDFQSWGGVNNYGPQMSMPQMQSPFNPYSNSSGQGGFAVLPQQGQMQSQGMRLDQPQGMRQIPQYMIEANKKAAALTALEAPTNYSAENMRDMMKSRQGGVPDYAIGGDYTGGKGFGGPMGGDMSVGAPVPSGMGESSVGSVGYAAPTTGGGTTTYGSFLPQMQTPFGYGGNFGSPQMQNPFSFQQPMMQPAAQPETRLAGSGISRRPARRAEGGIASLMDDVA